MEDYNGQGPPARGHEVPLDPNKDTRGSAAQTGESLAHATTEKARVPALELDGYVLYASSEPAAEELPREHSGNSIAPSSSVLDEENGRTYAAHDTGKYFLPNDAAEQDRLDFQHKVFKYAMDGALYKAPISSPRSVLDIATGTGIWAIEFAEEHPESNVIGTDLTLIQPSVGVPQNVQFFKQDSEHEDWDYPTPFDYIHLRCVLSCFDDHRTVMRKAYENLQPGGWIEYFDPEFYAQCTDGTLDGTHLKRLFQTLQEAMVSIGRDLRIATNYKQWLIEIGFVDVVEDVMPGPGNPWPTEPRMKQIGQWSMMNQVKGLRGMIWKILRTYGMEPDEIEDIVRLALEDIQDTRIHFYWPRYIVYGRKPYEGELETATDVEAT